MVLWLCESRYNNVPYVRRRQQSSVGINTLINSLLSIIDKPDINTNIEPIIEEPVIEEQATTKEECVVCLDKQPQFIVSECGHLCLCEDCVSSVNKCPICNHNKTCTIRIYKP